MAKSIDIKADIRAEITAVLAILTGGPATISAKRANRVEIQSNGSKSILISTAALKIMAEKGWVKRDGLKLQIAASYNSAGAGLDAASLRQTETVELFENGEVTNAIRVKVECPIDYLAAHKNSTGTPFLSKSQWSAGDRLRTDFTRANMLPGIGMRWGEPIRSTIGAGGGVSQTDAAMAAKLRVSKALDAVGPEFSGLLIDVCCYLKRLAQVEAERGWPQRSAKLMVRAGLSILERHYAPPCKTGTRLRNWGTDDYRPPL